jgi:hypothetical protein
MKPARLLFALFLLSCSAPVKHPTVVIVENRSFNEQSAQGEAKVFATPSPHTKLAAARAWRSVAVSLASTPAASYQAALRGSSELGPDYAKRGTKDDTTTKELEAEYEFKAGHDEVAAKLMVGVLESRIAMYVKKYATEVE